ncbi:hypothetical protein [Mucilaginibacter sp. NFR10]|uniref:hypothetical protein n=1 Tax=Mucilaginibacter sp. NFR10 TaxID=1566292 RepID=UPI0008716736|nr:hypothetical protein [Mucilaginibacter sp. NFR10]SCW65912.1 hypothetical protein SAMN03159284_02895 [Mucilaginibacter sp. NFR10]
MTKDKLIRLTKEQLRTLGYKFIKDSLTGAQGLFLKQVNDKYFVMLGLTISKNYPEMFTASFYLSKITIWGALWGDIPCESYERISKFLNIEERRRLLDDRFCLPGIVDGWWKADENGIVDFLNTLKITEIRFLSQENLFEKIESSRDIQELFNLSKKVINRIKVNDDGYYTLRFCPSKPIDDIPADWFKAAEKVIIDEKSILNANTVKRLAADAFRQKLAADDKI